MWIGFGTVVAAAVAVDLGVVHREARRTTLRRALIESALWIGFALSFGAAIWVFMGAPAGLEFFTSYVVEKSLSIDNIFLFLLIFQGLQVPARLQHKVLFYGIAGALAMRGLFVFGGIALLGRIHWAVYIFGGVLLFTAAHMFATGESRPEPERHWLLRAVQRVLPVAPAYGGDRFLVHRSGKLKATPLLLALVAVETADVIFAIDSVPAVLAITRDTFIAYSSNVFAILGLRALYFAVAELLPRFRFLRPGLAAILLFTGVKMVANDWMHLSTGLSLGAIIAIVAVMVGASIVWPGKKRPA